MRTVQNARYTTTAQSARKQSRIFTVATLVTGLSVAERALGFLYRIVLSRLIGAEGLGLYQVSLSVFAVFLTLGTGGIPLTVSRLIIKSRAEHDQKGASGAFTAGVLLSLALTLPVCILFGVFGTRLGFLFSDERCLSVFQILLIGLVFSSLYAVVRGGFWGEKKFLTPSVLELAEESVMVLAGVLLLQNVSSPLVGAKNAAWAAVISYLFSFTASFTQSAIKANARFHRAYHVRAFNRYARQFRRSGFIPCYARSRRLFRFGSAYALWRGFGYGFAHFDDTCHRYRFAFARTRSRAFGRLLF